MKQLFVVKYGLLACLLIVFLSLSHFSAEAQPQTNGDGEITFVVHANVKTLEEYREIAKQAARLKPFGKVDVNISTLADKGFHDVPEGNNYWYEYASYNPTPYKFFPDPKIAPFIPADFVKRNRDLLLGKAEILREYDLGAAFWSYEPNFLPEEFYEVYPNMRGPRVDHPRRSNHPAFAPDIHVEETREMYRNMIAELTEHVPELNSFFFKTNDAGSGICWAEWLYTGPNGPIHCQHYSVGETITMLMDTFKEGSAQAGGDMTVYMTGSMFTDEEDEDIDNHLREGDFIQGQETFERQGITSPFQNYYPVKGILNPLNIIQSAGNIGQGENKTVFVSFRASYDRDYEQLEVIDKVMSILEHSLNSSSAEGSQDEEEQGRYFCEQWAGSSSADQLCAAFAQLQEAERNRDFGGRLSSRYWGVSIRHITRPLVIAPQRLTPEEETYFLPHVFNVSEEEARMDYTDIHGSSRTASREAVMNYISMVDAAIELMDEVNDDAPEKEFIDNMIKGLKMNNSILRSSGNFAEAQAIRDRNAGKLENAPHRPSKDVTWTGDPDIQKFNFIMRDELDNTQELIDLLEDGGIELISHAKHPDYEDTFVLGPDLISQLKQKRKIMIRHWRDIEEYMASPLK